MAMVELSRIPTEIPCTGTAILLTSTFMQFVLSSKWASMQQMDFSGSNTDIMGE
eukprot:m.57296 g.57296  ORF g.57296 m.57296 type:complete len:54 (-) comp15604_c0_seq1:212-373(-)